MSSMFTSTVAAVSTPRGKGGIAVIRISGDDALTIGDRFLRLKKGGSLAALPSHTAHLATVLDEVGEPLDEAVITVFRAPRSFTGEDTVEISCHGGLLVTEAVLSSAFSAGAEPAGAGEFTRRAFSAGRLSLSEAEAVIGIIDAKTRASLDLSRRNLAGGLRKRTDEIYNSLRDIVSGVYAVIDFPDEDLSPLPDGEVDLRIDGVIEKLRSMRDSYRTGHAVCEGVSTVIFGKPNTGKSTILNLLAGKERAIVTDIAGTTRDVISETVTAGTVTLRLCDTAGIRETGDAVEQIGVLRSFAALDEAELVLAVFDADSPLDAEDRAVIERVAVQKAARGVTVIPVINKSDLQNKTDISAIEKALGTPILLCAKDEAEREKLAGRIEGVVLGELSPQDDAVVTGARQYAAVCEALSHAENAKAVLHTLGADIACTALESAMAKLGELDGREVTVDVVDSIFHRFCVGK